MYSVEVHADVVYPGSRDRITRYLVFETLNSAIGCIECLEAREPGECSPEDYFEAAKISRDPVGGVLNRSHPIQSDFVLTYIKKTFN